MERNTPAEIAKTIEESRPSNVIGLLYQIDGVPGLEKMVKSHTIADGAVGLFRSVDGNAYEIVIRPAIYAKHFKK